MLQLDPKTIDDRAREALHKVGINQADFHASPAHLSHGVRKRVAVARAMALEPNFVYFDDPDTGMDTQSLGLVHNVIERFCRDPEVTAVVATNHDRLMDRLGVRPTHCSTANSWNFRCHRSGSRAEPGELNAAGERKNSTFRVPACMLEGMEIAPLDPLCFDAQLLPQVVAPPYDVIGPELRASLGARHEHNVVHLDLPEGGPDERYENAKALFARWQKEGVLHRQGRSAFWRYSQTFDPPAGGQRCTRRGFFALVRAVPFSAGVVLPHERTLKGPKLDRISLSRATRATLSPQFMLYADPARKLDADLDAGEPFADFTTDDGVQHELSLVTSPEAISRIQAALAGGKLLIADGHHRYETAVTLAGEIDADARGQGLEAPRGEHLFTPALLANGDDPNLLVFPTHRLLHSLHHFDFEEFCQQARGLFDVTPLGGSASKWAAALEQAGGAALCAATSESQAVLLTVRRGADLEAHPVLGKRPEVVRTTAAALLHAGIIEHLLGVSPEAQAAKTNIIYLQDARKGLDKLAAGDAQVLFMMNATPVSAIRRVAEAGEVMPQKSTFFHPKVPTGLLIHTLDPARTVG